MRVFILDDEIHSGGLSNRSNLKDILRNHDLTLATSRFEAEELYRPGTYDLLLLDHDMGGFIDNTPGIQNTGYEFCKWLVENEKAKEKPDAIVHSHNPQGAMYMVDILRKHGFPVLRYPYSRHYEKSLELTYGGG